jgi:H+-transporting ATPase
MLSLTISTLLACFWPNSSVDNQRVDGLANHAPKEMAVLIWFYCLFWWFVQDAAKVLLYWWMEKYNILGINDSLHVNADLQKVDEATNPMMDEESGANLTKKLLH